MDLRKLRTIGYHIPVSCGSCSYGHFVGSKNDGYCGKFSVDVFRYGSCDDGEVKDAVKTGEWGELVDRRKFTRNNRNKAKARY